MATKRDFELGLQVTTLGSESVKKLKDEVDALAKSGGDAAPEFQQLSNELAELGTKAAALEVFDALARDVQALSLAQGAATRNANELSVELADLTAKTNAQRTAEQASLSSLKESREALSLKRDELARLKAETVASGNSDDAYKKKVLDLTLAIIDNRAEVRQRVEDYRQAKAATTAAVTEEAKLERAFNETTRQARDSTAALNEREAAIRDSLNALQALGVETKDLASSEIELLQALSQSEQALRELAQAQQYAKEVAAAAAIEAQQQAEIQKRAARDYAAFWEQALGQRERAEKDALEAQKAAALESERTAQTLKNALGTVGVKAAADLEREIRNVKDSLLLLKNSGTLTGDELDRATDVANRRIKELERNVREATGQLTLMDRAANAFKSTFGQTASGFIAAQVFQRLADYVLQAGSAFITANKQIESLRLGLLTIYKDAGTVSSQIDMLRKTADQAGVSIGSISGAFTKMAASFQASNIPLAQTNALFQSVTRASGALGLSGDETTRVLDALGQMAAKGTVSMEELRQQLGDALPGAFSLVAKGLQITEAELVKLVESGGLLARDLFPALTQALQGMQGEVNTLGAAFERLKNTFTTTAQSVGDAGWTRVLTVGLSGLQWTAEKVGFAFSSLSEGFFAVGRGVGAAAGAVANGGSVLDALVPIAERVQRALGLMPPAFDAAKASADLAAASQIKLSDATKQTLTAMEATTRANVALNVQTDAQAQKNALAGQSWTQLGIQLADVTKKSEAQIVVADQQRKAEEKEATNKALLIKLTSDATTATDAAVVAENTILAARTKSLAVVDRALAQQIGYRDALIQQIRTLGDEDGARTKSLDAINQRIAALTAESNQQRAGVNESRNAVGALKAEALAMTDNSGKLKEITAERTKAIKALEVLIELNRKGSISDEAVRIQREKLVDIEARYRDALKDTTTNLEIAQKAKAADFQITQAKLNLSLQEYKNMEAMAKAVGNESLARYALIEQKKIEIKIIEATVKAQIEEAKGSIAVAKAKLDELKVSEPNNKAKQAELEAAIKIAQARIIEAQARGKSTEALQREIDALRLGTNAKNQNKDASDKTANSVSKEADVRFKNADAIERENDAIAAQNGLRKIGNDYVDQNNFVTDKTGQRLTMDVQNRNSVYNRAKSAGLSASKSEEIATQFVDERGQYRGFSRNEPWDVALARVIGEAVRAQDLAAERSNTPGGTDPFGRPTTQPPGPPPPTNGQPVNIVINGVSSSVNVSSAGDAAKLRGIIEQLATAKGTSV